MSGLLASGNRVAAQAVDELFVRAQAAAQEHDFDKALRLAQQIVESSEKDAAGAKQVPTSLYYWRGRWHFQAGKIPESLADFDLYLRLRPQMAARLWERGITCYYAGQFAEGAKQFEQYQTYYDNDVENSVWRFLCEAKETGLPQAREHLMPIKHDPRVPLMQVFALFQGKATIDDVWTAVKADSPNEAELREREFFAHLYLSIYHDSHSQMLLAREHIAKAVAQYKEKGHYMWDVARIHRDFLERQAASDAAGKKEPVLVP